MDNQFSQPQLQIPSIPSDFESKAGSSKTDLIRAAFALLAGAPVTGLTPSEPSPYDLAAITAQLNALQTTVNKLNRPIRRVTLQGVNNGAVIVPFQDIGTINYQVAVAFITPNVNFDPIQWSVVEDSKTTRQVTLRLDGRVGTFKIEVTIISMDGI